jgi:hypothetical protein
MLHIKKTRLLFLVIFASLLSGCYESDHALLKAGEWADVAGELRCKSEVDGRQFQLQLTEQKSGLFSPTYTYVTNDKPPSDIIFKKLADRFYLAQVKVNDAFKFFYFINADNKQVNILVPNLMNPGPVDELAKQAHVQFRFLNGGDRIVLVGDDSAQLEFLSKHQQFQLMNAVSCTRT